MTLGLKEKYCSADVIPVGEIKVDFPGKIY
jgi:hypothetical protein